MKVKFVLQTGIVTLLIAVLSVLELPTLRIAQLEDLSSTLPVESPKSQTPHNPEKDDHAAPLRYTIRKKPSSRYPYIIALNRRKILARAKAVRIVGGTSRTLASIAASKKPSPTPVPLAIHPAVNFPDVKPHHQKIITETLAALPQKCSSSLNRLYVRYKKPKRRGLAGSKSIILDGTVPDEEFRALFLHEFGHVVDLGCFKGNASAGQSFFKDGAMLIYNDDPSAVFYTISWKNGKTKKSGWKKEDFASGYASYDPFEDFAEAFLYYVLQRDAFEVRAEHNASMRLKLAWFKKYIGDEQVAVGKHQWNNKVPWDTTKLSYLWKG